jgi:hypothetical protein
MAEIKAPGSSYAPPAYSPYSNTPSGSGQGQQTASTNQSPDVYRHETVSGPRLRPPDVTYLKTICGIAKIVQAVVCLIAFIIVLSVWFPGGGFVSFSTINGFIQAVIWFILHLVHAIPQILANYYIELIMYCILDLFLFIGAIVAAAHGWMHSAIGALSFFWFVATIACGIDTALQIVDIRNKFRASRRSGEPLPDTAEPAAQSQVPASY